MDGLTCARAIRLLEREYSLPRVPIVALTANAMGHDRAACFEAGMNYFLAKPFNKKQLRDVLHRALPSLQAETRKQTNTTAMKQAAQKQKTRAARAATDHGEGRINANSTRNGNTATATSAAATTTSTSKKPRFPS